MTSIKRVFAILGLAGATALTQTGCGDKPEFSAEAAKNPMNFAIAAKCPTNPTDEQRWGCVVEATKQSTYVFAQVVGKNPDLAASLTKACLNPVGKDVPNNSDVLMQIQASGAKKCFEALEKAAPSESKQEIKAIAKGVNAGLAKAGF